MLVGKEFILRGQGGACGKVTARGGAPQAQSAGVESESVGHASYPPHSSLYIFNWSWKFLFVAQTIIDADHCELRSLGERAEIGRKSAVSESPPASV